MKAKLALMLLMIFYLASIALAANNVIITQVLYDPLNESGGEAVEIFNPTQDEVDISGWAISTESSAADAVIPEGKILHSKGYYLIADSGWGFIHPELPADYEESITLANSDAGIALVSNGTLIDAVGWGNPLNIREGLFEGIPAQMVDEGQALLRKSNGEAYVETNNNSFDFASSVPSFHSSNSASNSEIIVVAIISDSPIFFSSINLTEDDDALTPGTQIMPIPKASRNVGIRAIISGNIQNASVSIGQEQHLMAFIGSINSTAGIYEANISIPFYMNAGNYSISLIAEGYNSQSSATSVNFSIMSMISIEIDTNKVFFSASSGSFSEVEGDLDFSSNGMVTLRNTGNTPVNFGLSGTDLSYGNRIIGIGNISYTFDNDYGSQLSGTLSHSIGAKEVELQPGPSSMQQLSLKLNVPVGTSSGNYTGKIFLSALS